jgi:excisionase family DNA binding protein
MSTFAVERTDAQTAARIYAAMNDTERAFVPRLIISPTETIDLDHTLASILREVVFNFSQGKAITVVSHEVMLTTQEAADFVGISRPTLIKMLDEYNIPFETIGRHRKIAFGDVQKLDAGLREERRRHLRRLQELSEESGEYESTLPNPLIR